MATQAPTTGYAAGPRPSIRVPADVGPGLTLCVFLCAVVAGVLLWLRELPSETGENHTPQVIQDPSASTGYEFIGAGVETAAPANGH